MPTIYEVLIEPRLEKATREGIEQGIERGIEKGEVIGRIRALQDVLQQPIDSKEDLLLLSPDELQLRAQRLRQMIATAAR